MEKEKRDWHDIMPHYRLFDDPLMMACFDDVETVQEVLRIILGRPFTVTEVNVQEKVPPSQWHGAVFDVTALDENGNKCDIAMFCRYLLRYIDKTRIAAPACATSFGRQ